MGQPIDRDFFRAVSAEFLATFMFVYVCVSCALNTLNVVEGANELALPTATLAISLVFGFTIFVLIHCFGHISGANINPAVTLALVATKQIHPIKGAAYAVAQCFGSIVASAIIMGTSGLDTDTMGGANMMSGPDDTKVLHAFVSEMLLTGGLVMTVFATVDPSREDTHLGPLAIGFAVGIAHLVNVPITGCGINPARSLGPALFAASDQAREDLWVFLVAPLVGALLAAFLYTQWFAEVSFYGGLESFYHKKAQREEKRKTEKSRADAPTTEQV